MATCPKNLDHLKGTWSQAIELTAAELESSDEAAITADVAGEGKWRSRVEADGDIVALTSCRAGQATSRTCPAPIRHASTNQPVDVNTGPVAEQCGPGGPRTARSVDRRLCLLAQQFDGFVHLGQVGIDHKDAFECE